MRLGTKSLKTLMKALV